MTGFGESSVNWEVRVWCAPLDVVEVRSDAVRAIKATLDKEGIAIPFPHRDVRLDGKVQVSLLERD